jgi:hypothetical protein
MSESGRETSWNIRDGDSVVVVIVNEGHKMCTLEGGLFKENTPRGL